MSAAFDLSVVLLHDQMVDKQGKIVTTSLTLLDIHDMARSSRTYGVQSLFIAHPAPALRKLAQTLQDHWEEGFGATYNPNRKEALARVQVVTSLDDAIEQITLRTGKPPKLIATSAHAGGDRLPYPRATELLQRNEEPYLLMFGTGWGMSEALLQRAHFFLEPIDGPTEYNHLSVRSACAITLDRLVGVRSPRSA